MQDNSFEQDTSIPIATKFGLPVFLLAIVIVRIPKIDRTAARLHTWRLLHRYSFRVGWIKILPHPTPLLLRMAWPITEPSRFFRNHVSYHIFGMRISKYTLRHFNVDCGKYLVHWVSHGLTKHILQDTNKFFADCYSFDWISLVVSPCHAICFHVITDPQGKTRVSQSSAYRTVSELSGTTF